MKQASDYFHGEENYNCAQAVLACAGASPELIEANKVNGGGRAPEGLCGALHAVRLLLNDEQKFRELCEEFARKTNGALTCRQLKGEARLPCPACLNLSYFLFEEKRK